MVVHCPKCQEEYDPATGVCSECGGGLLEGPLPLPEPEPLDPLFAAGNVVTVASSPSEAQVRFLEGLLRSEGIPTRVATHGSDSLGVFGGTAEPVYVLAVPGDRAEEARSVCQRISKGDPLDDVRFDPPEGHEAASSPLQSKASDERASSSLGMGSLALAFSIAAAALVFSIAAAATVWLLVGAHPPQSSGPSGPSQAAGRDETIWAVGGIAIGALLGGSFGLWVSRRRMARRVVVVLLLAFCFTPLVTMLVMAIWQHGW